MGFRALGEERTGRFFPYLSPSRWTTAPTGKLVSPCDLGMLPGEAEYVSADSGSTALKLMLVCTEIWLVSQQLVREENFTDAQPGIGSQRKKPEARAERELSSLMRRSTKSDSE